MRWIYSIVLTALLAGCGGGVRDGRTELDAGIESLIPPDTVALAGINVREVRKTLLYDKLAAAGKIPPELEEFRVRTGVDLKRDLRDFYVASNGKQALAIATLDLADPAAIEKELESKGAKRLPMGAHTLFTTGDTAVAFLKGKAALAGPLEMVKRAVEGWGAADFTKRQAVLAKLAGLPRGSHAWAVAVGGFPPIPVPSQGNLANLNRVFASLETTTLSVNLADGVALAASGLCADEKSAKQLHDTLKGLIGFGRLSTPSDKPEMLRLLDGIDLSIAKGEVSVTARVPADMLDYLVAQSVR